MRLLQWLFTREERKFLPEMVTTICFAVSISWFVCSYMLHQRDFLWESALYKSQDIDFDIYENLQALHMELLDTRIELLELELQIDDLQHPWQDLDLKEPSMELPGLYMMEDHDEVCRKYNKP